MSNDPLHGITLERMLTELVNEYGWEDLAFRIRINCFSRDPSIKSSLKFLRKTFWARAKVEDLYKIHLGLAPKEPGKVKDSKLKTNSEGDKQKPTSEPASKPPEE